LPASWSPPAAGSSTWPQTPPPRYVVLCAFKTFEVWEPGAVYREPRATFTLDEKLHRAMAAGEVEYHPFGRD
jgi:hypothetical protein